MIWKTNLWIRRGIVCGTTCYYPVQLRTKAINADVSHKATGAWEILWLSTWSPNHLHHWSMVKESQNPSKVAGGGFGSLKVVVDVASPNVTPLVWPCQTLHHQKFDDGVEIHNHFPVLCYSICQESIVSRESDIWLPKFYSSLLYSVYFSCQTVWQSLYAWSDIPSLRIHWWITWIYPMWLT